MKVYQKSFGIFRNQAVKKEIASLDAQRDHERIVHLMLCYEFAFDMVRANELALFATYASPSISKLLDKTGEFSKHGQKRYDDTRLLITKFAENGYTSEYGLRAIEQMNKIHGNFRIPNDDFIFVLSTLIFYPINWMEKYGWRKMMPQEKQGLFLFYREIGRRMGMQDLPNTLKDLQIFVDNYEEKKVVFMQSNRNVADATINIFKGWFPKFLHPVFEPATAALISQRLRTAFGFKKPSAFFCWMIQITLQIRQLFLRFIPITFMNYPSLTDNTNFRTYSKPIPIEQIGPTMLMKN